MHFTLPFYKVLTIAICYAMLRKYTDVSRISVNMVVAEIMVM